MATLLPSILDLVYADNWDAPEALSMRQALDAHFGNEEPALTEADLYIENKLWEQSLKRISKSLPPNVLTAFAASNPVAT